MLVEERDLGGLEIVAVIRTSSVKYLQINSHPQSSKKDLVIDITGSPQASSEQARFRKRGVKRCLVAPQAGSRGPERLRKAHTHTDLDSELPEIALNHATNHYT